MPDGEIVIVDALPMVMREMEWASQAIGLNTNLAMYHVARAEVWAILAAATIKEAERNEAERVEAHGKHEADARFGNRCGQAWSLQGPGHHSGRTPDHSCFQEPCHDGFHTCICGAKIGPQSAAILGTESTHE